MGIADSNAVISGFTEDQVRRLTGISVRQLRYWARDFFKPSLVHEENDGFPSLKMYSFRDVVCLKILNELRNEAKLPLQYLRSVKEKLAHLGEDMWAKTTLYIHQGKVAFDNPETGQKEEPVSGQGILQIPLRVVTGNMADAIRAMRRRNESAIGKIEKRRGVSQNRAVVSGTRIPVSSIKAFVEAGYSFADIRKQYPSLTDADIHAAIIYKDVA